MYRTLQMLFAAMAAAILTTAFQCSLARAAEWEENSPYYEDDAWYDVSEWLDGNDYNPMDETFGTWDEEVYDSNTGIYDFDDDVYYGYATDGEADNMNNWMYDYWEPSYSHYHYGGTNYDYAAYYHDYDGDGLYDSYTTYFDGDTDGIYEDVDTYIFNNTDTDRSATRSSSGDAAKNNQGQQATAASGKSSKMHEISGTIEKKKIVKVRGTAHLVVQIKQQDGTLAIADLGSESKAKDFDVSQGVEAKVQGPMTKVGDKQVLLAQKATLAGTSHEIDRNAREFKGSIVDTRDVSLQGQPHKLIVLKTESGKQRLVDAGPADRLQELDLRKDAQITVRGVPIKANDRPLVMAQSIEAQGQTVSIERQLGQHSQTAEN